MDNELCLLFAGISRKLLTNSEKVTTFGESDVINVPSQLSTNQIVMRKSYRAYSESVLLDHIFVYANKYAYAALAGCLLNHLCSDTDSRLEISLGHELSEIKKICIEVEDRENRNDGLIREPLQLHNIHKDLATMADEQTQYPESSLPKIILSGRNFLADPRENRDARDCLRGFGNPIASIAFAEYLLRFGSEENTLDELTLEGYPGYQRVSKLSSEITLTLPGADWWDENEFEFEKI